MRRARTGEGPVAGPEEGAGLSVLPSGSRGILASTRAPQAPESPGTDSRKAETQAQILEAAIELFARKGYDRTTIAAIAAQAQVSRAAVFWHFGDKATLFHEACRRLLIPFVEELKRELERMEPRKRVLQLFRAHEEFTSENQSVIEKFVGWALESPSLRAALEQPLITLHEAFNRELAEAVEEIVGDPVRAAALASGFLSLLDGNLVLSFLHPDPAATRRRREGLRLLAEQTLGASEES
jgi:AcrR family transcriptional regulator